MQEFTNCEQYIIKTHYKDHCEIGDLYVLISPKGIRGLFWQAFPAPILTKTQPASLIKKVEEFVEGYLQGKTNIHSLPMDLQGSDFQKKVWQEVLKIPYGQTQSYQQIATQIGLPKGARAVGTAIGKNPVCLLVPCHRVISADGSLGGFSGGLEIKKKLLQLERVPDFI
jgi:methylated-DNA-[protein]-cysteine S-methyltransferase